MTPTIARNGRVTRSCLLDSAWITRVNLLSVLIVLIFSLVRMRSLKVAVFVLRMLLTLCRALVGCPWCPMFFRRTLMLTY